MSPSSILNTSLASRASRANYYENLFIYSTIMLLGEKMKSYLESQQYNAVSIVATDVLTHFISMLFTLRSNRRVDAMHFFSLPSDFFRKPYDVSFNPLLEEPFWDSESALINMIKRSLFTIIRRVITLCTEFGCLTTYKSLLDKAAVCVFLSGMIYSFTKRLQIMQETTERTPPMDIEATQGAQDTLSNVSAAYSL